jgi:hypothetical protein
MSTPYNAAPGKQDPPIGRLVGNLTEQTSRLAKAEVKLAIREVTSKMKHAGMLLLACLVLGLATVMPAWIAALLPGIALLLLAAIAALVGRSQLRKGVPPVPEQAVARVREDIEVVTHQGKQS